MTYRRAPITQPAPDDEKAGWGPEGGQVNFLRSAP